MILDWLMQAPVLLLALFVTFVPGSLALASVGLRGLPLVAAAPLFSVSTTALIALACGAVGIAWSPLTWGIGTLILVAITWVLSRLLGYQLPAAASAERRWILPTALLIGILIGIWRLASYISEPTGISQTNDAVFHMNAVRYILETADASSLHVNAVIGGHSFYPAAWHGVVSLIVLVTGTSIPIAANIFTLVVGAFIWPLGIAWLTRVVTSSDAVACYAAILSSALQTFPLLMFQWGVLFPNALSIALVPSAVALVLSLPGWAGASWTWRVGVRDGLLILVAMAALLLAQPAAFLPWAAISAVWLTFWLFERTAAFGRARVITMVVATWLALIAVWLYLARSTSGSHWPPFRGKLEVFLDVILNGQVLVPFAFGVSALMIIGLVVAIRQRRLRWFALAWLGVSALYLMVAAIGAPLVRNGILGAWYADPYRIASLAPIVAIPLAAIGADAIVRSVARWARRSVDDGPTVAMSLAAVTVFMVLLVFIRPVAMPAVIEGSFDRESRYVAAADAYLNPDERALLESLDELVAADARVLGNPSTGTGFGYFLSGIDVYPRTWSPPKTEPWNVLSADLRDAATQPEVCEALAIYGDADYVLDFGLGEKGPGRYTMPGMTGFAGQDGFELVAEEGDVSLWRITACAQ
ncbi:DUF6541 family protein [Microbacterium sp. KRD172]|uniref:DUF6541 family protein n=1 Tax=Microbacterium sp. KRD172 TaxID=2729727 RepID=UPI0019D0FBBB|nr:DUF6541 family protein [Microbacterium sp. KRD172]